MQDNRKNARVSVLVPVRNGANHIIRKIKELDSITYNNIEILISVNKSTDHTSEIIKGLHLNTLKYRVFFHNQVLEIANHFAFLVHQARGEMVVFTAVDDLMSSNFLKEAIKALSLNSKAIAAMAPSLYEFDTHGSKPVIFDFTGSTRERIWEFTNKARVSHSLFYCLAPKNFVTEFVSNYPKEFIGRDWIFDIELLIQGIVISTHGTYIKFGEGGVSRDGNYTSNDKGRPKFLPYSKLILAVMKIASRELGSIAFPLYKFAIHLLISNLRRYFRQTVQNGLNSLHKFSR